jgi:copper(I)-binding protein
MKTSAALLAALLLSSCGAHRPPEISIENAWARATAPGQASAAVYMTIVNSGGEDKLTKAFSRAGDVSFHSSSMDGGVMRMRPLNSVQVPANSTVELKPAGTHIMVTGLKRLLMAGQTIELNLAFERSGQRSVRVKIVPAGSNGAAM